ncbi:glycosyltransferase family 2 protein [Alicycliphilus denitrificans]|uniref:glycosyltransferase family 2 protein n=1 Tax=Alicycliphilus denitrificans TaxID=179636 RepID=UPI00384EADB2
MKKIDIVVVNWNSGSQLKLCLDSLSSTVIEKKIVIDNFSSDDSAKLIADFHSVTLILSCTNLGFGKACNLGAEHAQGEFLLFLNPDAAVYPGTLEKSLAFMQDPRNADVGICGVRLKDETGHVARSCARFPSPWGFVAHALGLDRLFPRLGHSMAEWPHDSTRDVDQVIGAFFLVRRSVFDALGGFDERFFVYFEEVDFSRRARQAGWRSVYLADVQAFHAGGGTSNQVKARRLFYSLRSRLLYAHKHFGAAGFALTCTATLLLEPLSRTALALGRRSWTTCKETWFAYAMLWRWLPQWVFKGATR